MKFYCVCICHASLIGCTPPEAWTLLLPPSNTCSLSKFRVMPLDAGATLAEKLSTSAEPLGKANKKGHQVSGGSPGCCWSIY